MHIHKGEEINELIIDKSYVTTSCLFNNSRLSHYFGETFIIYGNGSEFKIHLTALCNSYNLVYKLMFIKNVQTNGILECIDAVNSDMKCTSNLDMRDTVTTENEADFITGAHGPLAVYPHCSMCYTQSRHI